VIIKRQCMVLVTCALLLFSCSKAWGFIDYSEYILDGVSVKVVSVDMKDRRVKITPEVSFGLPFQMRSFSYFLCRRKPLAAINGTYFNMETSTPVGEITIDGRKVNSSSIGTVFALTNDRKPLFFCARKHAAVNRKDFAMTLGAGPRLIAGGKISSGFRGEGFRDPAIFRPAVRSGLGVTLRGKLLMVVSLTAVDLTRWAQTLRILGCTDAINLDGGSSSALFYRGVMLVTPARDISNIIAVYEAE
jgi:uncharacterized protein YigE (DUF2233 family)